tara:strand:+ start:243 stop:497 length:255 start_codon:yes stop_codon:yes gene_type:complete
MTENKELVEERRIKLQAEEWGKQAKSLHGDKGIIETRFENGDIHYKENKKGGKSWTVYKNLPKETLLNRFFKRYSNSKPMRRGK